LHLRNPRIRKITINGIPVKPFDPLYITKIPGFEKDPRASMELVRTIPLGAHIADPLNKDENTEGQIIIRLTLLPKEWRPDDQSERTAYGNELRLIYNTITTYYLRSMLSKEPASTVSNIFVADEAQLLVPRILQKIVVTESWPATEFATRLRKRGCGLVLITQSPSNIEKDIFKNTATKIAFRLQSQEDIRLIAGSAGFSDIAEYEFLADSFVRLGRKQAIVCTDGKEPFLIKAADFEPSNTNVATAMSLVCRFHIPA
jgi:hypothetical protein